MKVRITEVWMTEVEVEEVDENAALDKVEEMYNQEQVELQLLDATMEVVETTYLN